MKGCEVAMKDKELLDLLSDLWIEGICFQKIGMRKWYNPMRYIKGIVYNKRIRPSDVYRKVAR